MDQLQVQQPSQSLKIETKDKQFFTQMTKIPYVSVIGKELIMETITCVAFGSQTKSTIALESTEFKITVRIYQYLQTNRYFYTSG